MNENTLERPSGGSKGRLAWVLFLGAILAGGVYAMPDVLAMHLQSRLPDAAGYSFCPFPVRGCSAMHFDQAFFAAQINTYSQTGPRLFAGDIWTFQDQRTIVPAASLQLLAYLVKPVGGMANLYVLASFLLPALSFILTVLFLRMFIPQLWLVVAAAMTVMFLNHFVDVVDLTRFMREGLSGGHWDYFGVRRPLKEFSRIQASQTTYPYLIGMLLALLSALRKEGAWRIVLAGVLLGGTSYIYFYHWTVLAAAVPVLVLGLWVSRNPGMRRRTLAAAGVAAVVALPLLWRMATSGLASGGVTETTPGRTLVIPWTLLLATGLLVAIVRRRGDAFWLLLSLAIGVAAALNIQLVTGFTVQPIHWTRTAGNFVVIFMLAMTSSAIITSQWPRRWFFEKRVLKPLAAVLTAVALTHGIWVNAGSALRIYPLMRLSNSAQDTYRAADKACQEDPGVFAASLEDSVYLRVFTRVPVASGFSWLLDSRTDRQRLLPLLSMLAMLNYPSDDLRRDLELQMDDYYPQLEKSPGGAGPEAFERYTLAARVWGAGCWRHPEFPPSWTGLSDAQVRWLRGHGRSEVWMLPDSVKQETLATYARIKKDPVSQLRKSGVKYVLLCPGAYGLPGVNLESGKDVSVIFSNRDYQLVKIQ